MNRVSLKNVNHCFHMYCFFHGFMISNKTIITNTLVFFIYVILNIDIVSVKFLPQNPLYICIWRYEGLFILKEMKMEHKSSLKAIATCY